MWIGREEFEALRRRVAELESRPAPEVRTEPVPTIRMDRRPYTYYADPPKYRINITHQVAILKILDHLGLKLEAVEGTPPDVKLVKKARAK